MKIYVFGSCSGTEPFPDRHHTAWALEIDGRYYWFDAGEGCAHTAHLMGVDLHAVSEIFISHPHMDHVGGLPHLLWTIRKLYARTKNLPKYGDVSVYISTPESFEGAMMMLRSEGGNAEPYQTRCYELHDGVIFENTDIRVTAKHNGHMKKVEKEGEHLSYSFLIEAKGKRIVYTGDLGAFEEIDDLIADGCDVLLTETGHHESDETCACLKDRGIGHVYFLHHGRPIMQHFDELLEKCRAIMPNVTFCNDKDVFEA